MSDPASVALRTELKPGDLGEIIRLHGVLYAREHGLDTTFEPYVARSLLDLVMPNPDSDASAHASPGRLWIAESGGRMVGTIGICRTHRAKEAQLRWFLVVPECRGGLGSRLIGEALGYCRAEGMGHVFLWTFDRLEAARRLYERVGFRETARSTHAQWGQTLTEVRMDLDLAT